MFKSKENTNEWIEEFKEKKQQLLNSIKEMTQKAIAEKSLFKQDKLLKSQINFENELSLIQDKRAQVLIDLVKSETLFFSLAEKHGMVYVVKVGGDKSSFFNELLNVNGSQKPVPVSEDVWEDMEKVKSLEPLKYATMMFKNVFQDIYVNLYIKNKFKEVEPKKLKF